MAYRVQVIPKKNRRTIHAAEALKPPLPYGLEVIESCLRCQLTHALDTQAALQGHHFSDLLVDAVSPEAPLFRRRASIFCKAPLKKSTSSVFSAKSCFRRRTCLR